ncbi:MAG: methylenetetrahydrofolate reductase [Propionibacteriaceae bacterium]|jgi:methylenetetrahydrofolate reductase (NADPH)|nr:methylenetetrahydrofolate reductase [Propionibacteriaceae bacterium]
MSGTVADLLARAERPLVSFEFFPPADDRAEAQLWQTLEELIPLRPDFVSVTYGANGSGRERTLGVTKRLAATTQRTMGHLTCVGQSAAAIGAVVDAYAEHGVRHILAIRGDMPGGPAVPWVPHPLGPANATQLVGLIRDRGDFCVGVGAFPDPHPSRHDPALDARLLKEKWLAGASFAITQLFFSVRAYVELVDRVRSIGCDIPVIAGLMPITQLSQVQRFAELSGAAIPAPVRERLEARAGDPAAVRATGIAVATELAQHLVAAGAPGLHFFTQNRSRATLAIWENLRAAHTVQ